VTWFAFAGYNGGKAIDIAGVQEKQAVFLGFHGYGNEKFAEAHPNSVAWWNPVARGFVTTIVWDYHAALKENAQPGGRNANILNPKTAVNAGVDFVKNSIPGLGNIDDFINFLRSPTLWERLGEIVAGGVILLVALKAITAQGNAPVVRNTARDTAKSAAKVAVKWVK
jgi:hypothetical protein